MVSGHIAPIAGILPYPPHLRLTRKFLYSVRILEYTKSNAFLTPDFQNMLTRMRLLSFCFTIAGLFFIYGECTKARYRSMNDLVFINGPFRNYTVDNAGKTHIFSFQLKNYSTNFIINNDYLHLLRFNSFVKLKAGQNINVGFLAAPQETINAIGKEIYVYAIAGNNENYLDSKNTIIQYNNKNGLLFGLLLLICAILSYRNSKKLSDNILANG